LDSVPFWDALPKDQTDPPKPLGVNVVSLAYFQAFSRHKTRWHPKCLFDDVANMAALKNK
jgi:hypothetical protein